MCKVLRFDNHAIKNLVKNHPLLKGKTPIGRGVFTAVYDGTKPNTVLKLTVDKHTYSIFTDWLGGVKHRHFPKLVKNYGAVAEARIAGEVMDVYLIEVERLERVKVGSDACKKAKAVMRAAWRYFPARDTPERLDKIASETDVPKSLRNALSDLARSMRDMGMCEPKLDLHGGNFMMRKNGELVINDPIYCQQTHRRAITRFSRGG